MYLQRTVITFFLASIVVTAGAQASLSSSNLAELPGIEITKTRIFNAESLYGYIDGGAELYLEYGFDTLVVTEIVSGEKDIKVESYRRSAYQLQFCKGKYYVSIINDTGTDAEQKTANEIAAFLLKSISDPPFDPGRFFEGGLDAETMKSAVLIRGPLGIYNGIPVLIDALGDVTGYNALIIRKDQKTIGSLRFDTPDAAGQFTKGINSCVPADTSSINNQSVVSIISPQHIIITF
jgi:hypothetical protein